VQPTLSDLALIVIAVFVAIALFHGWGLITSY